jgi:hypothetical protein
MPNAGRRILKWTRLPAQFEIHHSSIGIMRSILIKTVFRLPAEAGISQFLLLASKL